jgi:hypothetical protein
MRSHTVIDKLPIPQFRVEVSHSKACGIDFIELFSMGSVCSLHMTIQFRAFRRQYKEKYTPFSTGRFKLGIKLTSSVYLDCPDRKGCPIPKGTEELLCSFCSSAASYLYNIPFRDYIPCCKLFEDYPGKDQGYRSPQGLRDKPPHILWAFLLHRVF